MRALVVLIAAMLFLVGCGSEPDPDGVAVATQAERMADAPETATPPPAPTATPPLLPTESVASPIPAATPVATAIATVTEAPPSPTPEPTAAEPPFFGQSEEGAFYRGAAGAPVTLIDYSDFL